MAVRTAEFPNHLPRHMNDAADFRSFTLEEAFRHWTDEASLRHLDELKKYAIRPLVWFPDDPYVDNHARWWQRRKPLQEAFIGRIARGELVLTGFTDPVSISSRREVVSPELLQVLELDFETSEARGPGLKLIKLEVHEADASTERSVLPVTREFVHNADYSRVSIRGLSFDLSGGLCQIVATLHEAHLSGDPWLNGKQLLAECGYETLFMGDAFKRHEDPSWRELIEGNGRGLYRLNIRGQ